MYYLTTCQNVGNNCQFVFKSSTHISIEITLNCIFYFLTSETWRSKLQSRDVWWLYPWWRRVWGTASSPHRPGSGWGIRSGIAGSCLPTSSNYVTLHINKYTSSAEKNECFSSGGAKSTMHFCFRISDVAMQLFKNALEQNDAGLV